MASCSYSRSYAGFHGEYPFALKLAAHLVFTPIQLGLRNLTLAAVDILVVGGTIVWMIFAVWPHYGSVAVAQVPYLAWVSIANVLHHGLECAVPASGAAAFTLRTLKCQTCGLL